MRYAVVFHIDGLHADGESEPDTMMPAESADPFAVFTEWAGAIDDEDYADL